MIEAVEAHSEAGRRVVDQATVIEPAPNGATAFRRLRELHRASPARELYFETLEIDERPWVGGGGRLD